MKRSCYYPWAVALISLATIFGCAESKKPELASSEGSSEEKQPPEEKDWSEHTQELPFIIGYEKGMEAAKSQDKPAMLFVTTTWCPPCKKLAEEDLTNADIRKLLENFVLVIVDGDVEETVTSKLGVEGFPTIVFQTPGGEILEKSIGYIPPAEFKALVESALAKVPKA